MIDLNDLEGLLELATDYVDDGLHFLTEPVSYGDLMILTERLIAAEKDAARYRWMIEHGDFGVGKWGKDWDLRFEGPAPEHAGEIDSFIDEDIKCIVE